MTTHEIAPGDSERSIDSAVMAVCRVQSIDALRGLVMFSMIFVNDIAGVSSKVVPGWLKHYQGKNGMTFVDLVFPAFLFIVGMSIPFAIGNRLNNGESVAKTLQHTIIRTLSLLLIGIMMVNGSPSTEKMGWSGAVWSVLMYMSAILAFCTLLPKSAVKNEQTRKIFSTLSNVFRGIGLLTLLFLALIYRGPNNERILTLYPFAIRTSWYGILGLIAWAYLIGSLIFLLFRHNRTALLTCFALLMCLYPAAKTGAFDGFWLGHYVGIGDTLGALPSITVAGIILATIFLTSSTTSLSSKIRFTVCFITACSAAALLLHRLYGINKNAATPSWCLWACAITAAFWLFIYYFVDLRPACGASKLLVKSGQNVLLAYLLSNLFPSFIWMCHAEKWYGSLAEHGLAFAIIRSAICAAGILAIAIGFNSIGFRTKL